MAIIVNRQLAATAVAQALLAAKREVKEEVEVRYQEDERWLALPEVSDPIDQQIQVLQSTAQFTFAIAGIQSGKTGVGGHWIFDRMWEKTKTGVYFIVGPDYPQLKKSTMFKFLNMIPGGHSPGAADSWLNFHNKTDKHMRFKWGDDLFYGSADDPDSLRGPTIDDWWIDEIGLCAEAFKVMQGRLIATGGRGLCTGTPKGTLFLEDIQTKAETRPQMYSYHTWSSFDNPGADQAFLEELAEDWPEDYKKQELYAELVDWGEAPFKKQFVTLAADSSLHFGKPNGGGEYLKLWDLARKRDWVVNFVLDISEMPAKIVHMQRFQKEAWPKVVEKIEATHHEYPGVTRIDSTGIGDVVEGFLNIDVEGFIFTPKSKNNILLALQGAIEHELIKWPTTKNEPEIAQLIRELRTYRWADKGLVKDCVMSLAMGAPDLFMTAPTWDDAVQCVTSTVGRAGGDW